MKNYWTDRIRYKESINLMRCLSQGGSWLINWEYLDRFLMPWEKEDPWGRLAVAQKQETLGKC